MVAPTTYARNEEIFGEGEPADYLYKLETGCVRATRTLDNGRRQLIAFYLSGDLFGLDARDLHAISTEATTPGGISRHQTQGADGARRRPGDDQISAGADGRGAAPFAEP